MQALLLVLASLFVQCARGTPATPASSELRVITYPQAYLKRFVTRVEPAEVAERFKLRVFDSAKPESDNVRVARGASALTMSLDESSRKKKNRKKKLSLF